MRWELARRDLVEQRREQVVVLPVEERELGFARAQDPLEAPDEMQPGEPTTDDDDLLGHQLDRGADSIRSSSWM
jgi:hypothetical protein